LPVSNHHLQALEAEAIHALREAAAVFRKPVILYSIGKDSSVLLHLAMKAFHPAKPPFALLHVDTTWKFREMIAFRDRRLKELGLPLIVHVNRDGLARGIGPLSHGAAVHTDIMKTEALKQALDGHGFDAATRSRRVPRSGSSRCAVLAIAGIRAARGPSCGTSTTAASIPARASASSRCRTGPSSTSGPTSRARTFPSCRSTSRRAAWWSSATAC
jgi:3'-phosphoadenosine 5'-phosphosulfate sulfotransferase (PAPS reductase)/FAD synthetase